MGRAELTAAATVGTGAGRTVGAGGSESSGGGSRWVAIGGGAKKGLGRGVDEPPKTSQPMSNRPARPAAITTAEGNVAVTLHSFGALAYAQALGLWWGAWILGVCVVATVLRVVVEAAWSYRHRPHVAATLRKRQQGLSPAINEMAWKAQHRLHKRFVCLQEASKPHQKVVTAVGRELLGFIWAIGLQAQREKAQAA